MDENYKDVNDSNLFTYLPKEKNPTYNNYNNNISNSESIDELIKNMESDQGLLNIIKNYREYESKKKNRELEVELESEDTRTNKLNLFSNYLIQSSFTKFNILKV